MKCIRIIIPLVALSFTSCGDKKMPKEDQNLMEASKQELVTALQERDQLLALVKEIAGSMEQIKKFENIVTLSGSGSRELTAQRTQIISDLNAVKKTLKQRQTQLNELESRLKESTLYTQEQEYIVDVMRRQIEIQTKEIEAIKAQFVKADEQIRTLTYAIDSLNTTVAVVGENRDSVLAAAIVIENELNSCYYAIASKSELKDHHIIETGFLQKTKVLNGDFDKSFFTIDDKRSLNSMPLQSSKAKILTNHPASSYEIKEIAGRKVLYILDRNSFWSLTNYLVIQTD